MLIDPRHPVETGSAGAFSAVTNSITGVSNTILGWLDAFCVTDACDQAQLDRDAAQSVADTNLQAAQQQVVVASIRQKSTAALNQTAYILGAGALGVAALWVVTRKD